MYKCQRCGASFDRQLSPAHLKRNQPRYCSRSCAQPNRRSRVTLRCRVCRRQFERKAYMAEWSQERGPFCGFGCYAKWQSENTDGARNPNYKPDLLHRQCVNWYMARDAALDRDGHRCCKCGHSERLHVHHKNHDPDDHALDNLETLCAGCHRREHPLPRAPNGKFVRSP